MKDIRSLRDKPVQQAMRNSIFAFLQATNFPGIFSKQTLISPTAKDFKAIVEHLVGILDEDFRFGQRVGEKEKRFDEEVVPVLDALGYPFASTIDKKWLAAPASMH